MRIDHLPRELIAATLSEKRRAYLNTLVNLFLLPRFITLCEKDLETAETEERREALTQMVNTHKLNLKAEQDSKETWELLLDYLYDLYTNANDGTK